MKTTIYSLTIFVSILVFGCDSNNDSSCDEINWYQDNDKDGKGNAQVIESTCEQPDGYVSNTYDDDDTGNGFTLNSIAVANGALLDDYKCETKTNDVENSIPLSWTNVPEGTGSLAIVMYHYPNPDDLTKSPNSYLLLWDIDPSVNKIEYGKADDGPWYMGSNKDGTAISYTSPCSHSAGMHEYTIKIYALSATPASLPETNSLEVNWDVMQIALSAVTIIEEATLVFTDVN